MKTCEKYVLQSSGGSKPKGQLGRAYSFPNSYSMPPNHGAANATDWNVQYGPGLDALIRCCEDPTRSGCKKVLRTIH